MITGAWPTNLIVVCEIAYLVVASAIPALPGWKMFSNVTPVKLSHIVSLSEGEMNLAPLLPRGTRSLKSEDAKSLLIFICERRRETEENGLWSLTLGENRFEVQAPACLLKKI